MSISYMNLVSILSEVGKSKEALSIAGAKVIELEKLGIRRDDKSYQFLQRFANQAMSSEQSSLYFDQLSQNKSKLIEIVRASSAKRVGIDSMNKTSAKRFPGRGSLRNSSEKITGKTDPSTGVKLRSYCHLWMFRTKMLYVCDEFSLEHDKSLRNDKIVLGQKLNGAGPKYDMYNSFRPRWQKGGLLDHFKSQDLHSNTSLSTKRRRGASSTKSISRNWKIGNGSSVMKRSNQSSIFGSSGKSMHGAIDLNATKSSRNLTSIREEGESSQDQINARKAVLRPSSSLTRKVRFQQSLDQSPHYSNNNLYHTTEESREHQSSGYSEESTFSLSGSVRRRRKRKLSASRLYISKDQLKLNRARAEELQLRRKYLLQRKKIASELMKKAKRGQFKKFNSKYVIRKRERKNQFKQEVKRIVELKEELIKIKAENIIRKKKQKLIRAMEARQKEMEAAKTGEVAKNEEVVQEEERKIITQEAQPMIKDKKEVDPSKEDVQENKDIKESNEDKEKIKEALERKEENETSEENTQKVDPEKIQLSQMKENLGKKLDKETVHEKQEKSELNPEELIVDLDKFEVKEQALPEGENTVQDEQKENEGRKKTDIESKLIELENKDPQVEEEDKIKDDNSVPQVPLANIEGESNPKQLEEAKSITNSEVSKLSEKQEEKSLIEDQNETVTLEEEKKEELPEEEDLRSIEKSEKSAVPSGKVSIKDDCSIKEGKVATKLVGSALLASFVPDISVRGVDTDDEDEVPKTPKRQKPSEKEEASHNLSNVCLKNGRNHQGMDLEKTEEPTQTLNPQFLDEKKENTSLSMTPLSQQKPISNVTQYSDTEISDEGKEATPAPVMNKKNSKDKRRITELITPAELSELTNQNQARRSRHSKRLSVTLPRENKIQLKPERSSNTKTRGSLVKGHSH